MRLIKHGEEKWRIVNIGISSLSNNRNKKYASKTKIQKKFHINFDKPIVIFTFHPLTYDMNKTKKQIKICVESIIELSKKLNVIVTYPNDDYGSKHIISEYKKLKKYENVYLIKSLGKYFYHSLMNLNLKNIKYFAWEIHHQVKRSIFFNCFSINLGERQLNRIQLKNVINTEIEKKNY